MSERIRYGRTEIVLHHHAGDRDPPLLLLPGLRESGAVWKPPIPWPGAVFGLDFSGHGEAPRLRGGAYQSEFLAAEVDTAVARLGGCVLIAGRGLGAYVALLVAGARPERVPGALLLDGPGLRGGGDAPDFTSRSTRIADPRGEVGEDPMLALLESEIRPPDYAAEFAAGARHLLLESLDPPAPGWWAAVEDIAQVHAVSSAESGFAALRELAGVGGTDSVAPGPGA